MCLAMNHDAEVPQGAVGRAWRWLSADPFRLMLSLALLHLPLLILAGLADGGDPVVLLGATYGVVAMPLLGYLMTAFPRWFGVSTVHHVAYFSTFLLAFTGLVAVEMHAQLTGLLLLAAAWMLALRTLHTRIRWVGEKRHPLARPLLWTLGIGLPTLLLALPGLLWGEARWIIASLVAGTLLVLLPVLLMTLVHRRRHYASSLSA
jgi:hypothetical protein